MASYELPELEGTEKQIHWANRIRKDIIRDVEISIEDETSQIIAIGRKLLQEICDKHIKAGWWIDNRDSDYFLYVYDIRLEKRLRKAGIFPPVSMDDIYAHLNYYKDSGKVGAKKELMVKFNNKWYLLITNAIRADYCSEYYAFAMCCNDDNDENIYIVTWYTTKEWKSKTEEERLDPVIACNWGNPSKIEVIYRN